MVWFSLLRCLTPALSKDSKNVPLGKHLDRKQDLGPGLQAFPRPWSKSHFPVSWQTLSDLWERVPEGPLHNEGRRKPKKSLVRTEGL